MSMVLKMDDGISIKIEGLKELEKKMISLGPKLGRQALKSALVAGAIVVRKEAQMSSPVDSGRLRKAMYIKKMAKPNPFKENVIFGVRHGRKTWKKGKDGQLFDKSNDAFYWKFLEFGTKYIKKLEFVQNAFKKTQTRALARIKEVLADKISVLVREK